MNKHYYILIALGTLLFSNISHVGAQSLNLEPFKLAKGEVFMVNINLSDECAEDVTTVRGVQCCLTLPDGFSFQKDMESDQYVVTNDERLSNNHQTMIYMPSPQKLEILLLTTADDDYFLRGAEGPLFQVWVKADEATPFATYSMLASRMKLVRETGTESIAQSEISTSFNYYTNYTVTTATDNEAMGSVSEGAVVESGTPFTVIATPTEGYEFVAWKDGEKVVSTNAEYTFSPTKSQNLTAYFKAQVFTATFRSYREMQTVDVAFGDVIVPPEAAERLGYTFSAWDPELPSTMPAKDVTFVARYTVNTYVVRYYYRDILLHEDKVAYGAPVVLRDTDDEIFEGYFVRAWVGETYETMPAYDIEYHADIATAIHRTSFETKGVDVWTTDGAFVGAKMSENDIQKLRPGIYIINGKKLIVK